MNIFRTPSGWSADTPAKINLFLEVLGKRSDGYHEIVSVALPIQLFDTLTLEPADDGIISFICTGQSSDVPTDETNIVVKAIKAVQTQFHIRQGAAVHLHKRIPSQAGLGGGSSDAAAAVQLALKMWNITITQQKLAAFLADLGSDCPIFLYDSPSLSTGRGDAITPLPPQYKPLWFILWKPAEGLSTADVYRNCMPLHDGRFRKPDALITALASGNVDTIAGKLFNRLEVPARHLWHGFDEIKKKMTAAGCVAVQLCGSGTTVFGLCYDKRHAEETALKLSGNELRVVCSVND